MAALALVLLAAVSATVPTASLAQPAGPHSWIIEPSPNGWSDAPVNITGRATASAGVSHFFVALKDVETGEWWNFERNSWQRSWKWYKRYPHRRFATSTAWSVRFDPPRGSGHYLVRMVAYDAQGRKDSTPSQIRFHTTPANWKLVFQDEFSGGGLSKRKWGVLNNSSFGTGDSGLAVDRDQCYMASNVRTVSGQLELQARRQSPSRACSGRFGWTSGMVVSNDDQRPRAASTRGNVAWTYGRVAVRARFDSEQGLWPAIWLRPRDNRYGAWPRSGEIDIMEHAGPNPTGIRPECRGSVTSSAHWRGASGAHLNAPGCVTLDELRGGKIDTWHVYELIWSPTRLVWKVDGVVTRRSTPETDNWWAPGAQSSAAPFDQPFFLTLNLQVAGWANHPNPALQSGSMWIDWVRVWQRR